MFVDFSFPASIEMQRKITETILQTTQARQQPQSQIITHESLGIWRTREQISLISFNEKTDLSSNLTHLRRHTLIPLLG